MLTNPNVKINLGLNILRKREDGFHDLETLFVPYFGISDTLEIIVEMITVALRQPFLQSTVRRRCLRRRAV